MNYLSHYYILREYEHPAFANGKIIPDLLRIFGPDHKIRKARNIEDPEGAGEWMMKGAYVHLESDRLFHDSDYFERESQRLKEELRAGSSIRKYRYFYAHILLEMLLDRLLVKKYPELGQRFYDDLEQIEERDIQAFFELKPIAVDANEFMQVLSRFRKSRYLFEYAYDPGFLYAFSRILKRVGMPLLNREDRNFLIRLVQESEERLEPEFLSILQKIETGIR
jgi:hypothetical protein